MAFADDLKRWREREAISQADAAEVLEISRPYFTDLENGKKLPSGKLVNKFASFNYDRLLTKESAEDDMPGGARSRLRRLRKSRALTVDQLATLSGVRASTINNLEAGYKGGSERVLELLAKALGVPADELMAGSDLPRSVGFGTTFGSKPETEVPPGMKARTIPVVSFAQAGLGEWEDFYEHEGVEVFDVRDPKALATIIRGDSMEPKYPEGSIVVMYPSFQPRSGNLVIVRLKDGNVMFKRFESAGDKYHFVSLNPIYPPITVAKSEVEKIVPVGKVQTPELL